MKSTESVTTYFGLKKDFYKEHPRVEKRTWVNYFESTTINKH